VKAVARLVAVADAAGRTRLSLLRGEPPLLPRRTGVRPDGAVVVHLVGGAAGPLGGDHLALDVEVRPGAVLEIRSVAATLALPGRPLQMAVNPTTGRVFVAIAGAPLQIFEDGPSGTAR
jgi:urease accessory protein